MKNILKITTSFLLVSFFNIFAFGETISLNNNPQTEDDKLQRIAWASYFIEEANFQYSTALGDAVSNTILESVRNFRPIPQIDYSGLRQDDKIKIDNLILSINQIIQSPPDWQQILKMEEKRLIEYDRTMRRQSIYH